MGETIEIRRENMVDMLVVKSKKCSLLYLHCNKIQYVPVVVDYVTNNTVGLTTVFPGCSIENSRVQKIKVYLDNSKMYADGVHVRDMRSPTLLVLK